MSDIELPLVDLCRVCNRVFLDSDLKIKYRKSIPLSGMVARKMLPTKDFIVSDIKVCYKCIKNIESHAGVVVSKTD